MAIAHNQRPRYRWSQARFLPQDRPAAGASEGVQGHRTRTKRGGGPKRASQARIGSTIPPACDSLDRDGLRGPSTGRPHSLRWSRRLPDLFFTFGTSDDHDRHRCAGCREPGGLHRRTAAAYPEQFGGGCDPGGRRCAKSGGLSHRGQWEGSPFREVPPGEHLCSRCLGSRMHSLAGIADALTRSARPRSVTAAP